MPYSMVARYWSVPCVASENHSGSPRARRVSWMARSDGFQSADSVSVSRYSACCVCARCALRGVAVDQGARVERREQPLVRVDDHRVGVLDPRERGPHPLDEHRGEAVGAVDVQPDVAGAA